jgi:hypothetical protein
MSVSPLAPVIFTLKNVASQPRACVKLDGVLYNLDRYEIKKNAHGATNTANFVLPYTGNPDWPKKLFRDPTTPGPVYCELWAGFPTNPGSAPSLDGLSRRFFGIIDQYEAQDMDVTEFTCRSIAAPLTTDRVSTSVQNMTTVDFLKATCAPYNLKIVIDPELTNPATLAKVYAQEYIVGLHNLIKWDVLLRSSIVDDVDVWEDDGTLYYVHPWNVVSVMQSQGDSSRNYSPISLTYGTSIKSFEGTHAPQFSRQIRVHVFSYTAKIRQSVSTRVQSVVSGVDVSQVAKTSYAQPQWGQAGGTTTTYGDNGSVTYSRWSSSGGSSSGSNAPISESGIEHYNIPIVNATPAECQAIAEAIWRQISMHEYQGKFVLDVTPETLPYFNIEGRFSLAGYGMSAFNTQYWPRDVTETFEMSDEGDDAPGWTVEIQGVNHTLPLGGGV